MYNLDEGYARYNFAKEWDRPTIWTKYKNYIKYYLSKVGLRDRDPDVEDFIGK